MGITWTTQHMHTRERNICRNEKNNNEIKYYTIQRSDEFPRVMMHTIDSHNNSMAEEFSKWKPFSHHAITAYTHIAAEPAQCTYPSYTLCEISPRNIDFNLNFDKMFSFFKFKFTASRKFSRNRNLFGRKVLDDGSSAIGYEKNSLQKFLCVDLNSSGN